MYTNHKYYWSNETNRSICTSVQIKKRAALLVLVSPKVDVSASMFGNDITSVATDNSSRPLTRCCCLLARWFIGLTRFKMPIHLDRQCRSRSIAFKHESLRPQICAGWTCSWWNHLELARWLQCWSDRSVKRDARYNSIQSFKHSRLPKQIVLDRICAVPVCALHR